MASRSNESCSGDALLREAGTRLVVASRATGPWLAPWLVPHWAFAVLKASKPSGISCLRSHVAASCLQRERRKNEQVCGKALRTSVCNSDQRLPAKSGRSGQASLLAFAVLRVSLGCFSSFAADFPAPPSPAPGLPPLPAAAAPS